MTWPPDIQVRSTVQSKSPMAVLERRATKALRSTRRKKDDSGAIGIAIFLRQSNIYIYEQFFVKLDMFFLFFDNNIHEFIINIIYNLVFFDILEYVNSTIETELRPIALTMGQSMGFNGI